MKVHLIRKETIESRYRMICKYVFGQKQVHLFISWIGTHAEYDELCDKNKQYTITDY